MEVYLKNLSKRYRAGHKGEKGILLQELCDSSGYHKKHAIRLLNTASKKKKRRIKTGRPNVYPENIYIEPLKRIWLLSDQSVAWLQATESSTHLVPIQKK